MNGRTLIQGGKNWILPKEIDANRFFRDSYWLEIWKNHFCPSMRPNGGSVAMDSGQTTFVPVWDRMEGGWQWTLYIWGNSDLYEAPVPARRPLSILKGRPLCLVLCCEIMDQLGEAVDQDSSGGKK